jgi:tetratricopeptide (TPR) repeat protein
MRTKQLALLLGTIVCLASAPCFSQSSARQQDIEARKQKAQQDLEVHRQKAAAYLRENKPELAIPEFRAIVALDPRNVDANANLGVLLYFQGNYAEAIAPFRAAVKLKPNLWKIEALLGIAEKRTADFSGAVSDLEKAFPKLEEQIFRTQVGMELLEIYSGTGHLDKAAATIDTLRELDPTNLDVQYASYRIHSDLASESLLTLLVLGPKSARAHQVMAHELARQGNTEAAIRNYREAIKLDPQLPGLHFEMAEMLNDPVAPNALAEAESEYKAELALNPLDEKSECKLGDIAAGRNEQQQAYEHYSRALQLQPNDAEAALGLAKVLMAMKQPDKAEPLLQRALQLDPTSAVAHYRLSTIYRQTGRTADAKRELQEYQKYKDMKDKLRDIYREMRIEPAGKAKDEPDARM